MFHSFPRLIGLSGPGTLNFLYSCKCRKILNSKNHKWAMQPQLCQTEDIHDVCVYVNTPPQVEKLMHSLLHSKNSCQCEEPFSHFETINQKVRIPERDSGAVSHTLCICRSRLAQWRHLVVVNPFNSKRELRRSACEWPVQAHEQTYLIKSKTGLGNTWK